MAKFIFSSKDKFEKKRKEELIQRALDAGCKVKKIQDLLGYNDDLTYMQAEIEKMISQTIERNAQKGQNLVKKGKKIFNWVFVAAVLLAWVFNQQIGDVLTESIVNLKNKTVSERNYLPATVVVDPLAEESPIKFDVEPLPAVEAESVRAYQIFCWVLGNAKGPNNVKDPYPLYPENFTYKGNTVGPSQIFEDFANGPAKDALASLATHIVNGEWEKAAAAAELAESLESDLRDVDPTPTELAQYYIDLSEKEGLVATETSIELPSLPSIDVVDEDFTPVALPHVDNVDSVALPSAVDVVNAALNEENEAVGAEFATVVDPEEAAKPTGGKNSVPVAPTAGLAPAGSYYSCNPNNPVDCGWFWISNGLPLGRQDYILPTPAPHQDLAVPVQGRSTVGQGSKKGSTNSTPTPTPQESKHK